jgi:hypothetical protein
VLFCGKKNEMIDEILSSQQTAVFRSRAAVLDELAISHRLSLMVGRAKYGLPEDFSFAIKSIESVVHNIDVVDQYDLALRFEVITRRKDIVTALRSILTTKHGVEARTTTTSFNVLPPSLSNFVRRSRQFLDFSEVKISRDKAHLEAITENHLRYYPSEDDRLSDGKRVDHVPALTLIDIALSVNGTAHDHSNIAAEFLNYTDPRISFDIIQRKDLSAVEFVQNGQTVALVELTACAN